MEEVGSWVSIQPAKEELIPLLILFYKIMFFQIFEDDLNLNPNPFLGFIEPLSLE